MKLYDSLQKRLETVTKNLSYLAFPYEESRKWPETSDYEVILQKDTGLELGGVNRSNANFTCISTDQALFPADEIRVYGSDLPELRMPTDFARVCEVIVREESGSFSDPDRLYRFLQDIDFVKYHVYPFGYMIRSSGQSPREQIRVSRKALREGISFAAVGNTYIYHYRQNPAVLRVRVSFITTPDADYPELQDCAKTAAQIRNSLSQITKGLPKDCASCSISEICADIEGLRELHFGKQVRR